ncbi:MAG: dihydrolipoyl dehydrogenase [Patescibacteria group bacterium]
MYDLVIIGAGWAGFSAATYAAKMGLKTVLIEKDSLGGTCLNYGCIPTKTILNTTKLLSQLKKSAKFGITSGPATINLALMNQRTNDVVNNLKSGMEFILRAHKIDLLKGIAVIVHPEQVKVNEQILEAKYIIIATGSRPMELPKIKFDGNKIISSTEALRLQDIPGKILIIGGGVIGCEFAEVFLSLGSEVEIVELTANLLPGIDKEAAKRLEILLKKRGARILLNTDATTLNLENYDKVLLCIGRVPYSDCFDGLGIKKERARIAVNEYLQSDIANIYAAGDCIGGYLLAHVASYEGRLAVKNIIAANKEKVNYKAVPSCVYTNPEIATVGLGEDQARKDHGELLIKRIDFKSIGMSYVIDQLDGFVKIIADKQGNLLGASIIGPKASELIHVLTIALNNGLNISQIKETIFAHPTVSESISEALLH